MVRFAAAALLAFAACTIAAPPKTPGSVHDPAAPVNHGEKVPTTETGDNNKNEHKEEKKEEKPASEGGDTSMVVMLMDTILPESIKKVNDPNELKKGQEAVVRLEKQFADQISSLQTSGHQDDHASGTDKNHGSDKKPSEHDKKPGQQEKKPGEHKEKPSEPEAKPSKTTTEQKETKTEDNNKTKNKTEHKPTQGPTQPAPPHEAGPEKKPEAPA